MKLSFIVPVYNVEDYLRECVDSILDQCTDECEIILVDDGSTDNSGAICDEFCDNVRVSVIHQQNGGLSAARNTGMDSAVGEYLAFVDSDDRIAEGAVADILKWINTTPADICFMDGIKFYPDGTEEPLGDDIHKADIFEHSKEQVIEYLAQRPKYPGSACTKIFNRAFLEKNNLRFPHDRRLSEDLGFIRDCLLLASTFDALNIPYYEYRQNRVGSITNSISAKSYRDLCLFVEESVQKLMSNGQCHNVCSCSAMSFAAYEYTILLWRAHELPTEEYAKASQWLKKYRSVLKYGKSKKAKVIYVLSCIVGLHIVEKILTGYKKYQQK